MTVDLGMKMVRLRVSAAEAKDDARILELRKKRREELLAEAREDTRPRGSFVVTWFRGRRTIAAL